MSHQHRAEFLVRQRKLAHMFYADCPCPAWHLHKRRRQEKPVVESHAPAQNAVAADHPGLDHAAVAQFDDERDKSGDREIHPFEAFIRPCHHGPVLQFNRYEVWSELIECLRGEAREQTVFAVRHRASSVQGGALSRLSGTDARIKSASDLKQVLTLCGKIQRGICAHRPSRQKKWRFCQLSNRATGWDGAKFPYDAGG